MTSAVYRTTPSLSIPQSQNTAPVLEHNCLFTHDIKRKQKRWQDGFLRYHTFNKRIMIYDVPRNFVGDTHWTASEVIHEGDEVVLDKWGVLVEVADIIGRTETDLSQLRPAQKIPSPAASSFARPKDVHAPKQTATQPKHRSLNAMLGTSRGAIGRAALPTKSPFENRHQDKENEARQNCRLTKRPRLDPVTVRGVPRTRKTPSKPVGNSSHNPVTGPWHTKKKPDAPSSPSRFNGKEVIDLSEDVDERPASLLNLSGEEQGSSPSSHLTTSRQTRQTMIGHSSSPVSALPRMSTAEEAASIHNIVGCEKQMAARAFGTILEKSINPGTLDFAHVAQEAPGKPTCVTMPPSSYSPRPYIAPTDHFLKVTARSSSRKKTLLCQEQLTKRKKKESIHRLISIDTDVSAGALLDSIDVCESGNESAPIHAKLKARLARINQRDAQTGGLPPQNPSRTVNGDDDDDHDAIYLDTNCVNGSLEHETPNDRTSTHEEKFPDATTLPCDVSHVKIREATRTSSRQSPAQHDLCNKSPVVEKLAGSKGKRAPGAPVRFTPSPTKNRTSITAVARTATRVLPIEQAAPTEQLTAFSNSKSRPAVNCNAATNSVSAVALSKTVSGRNTNENATTAPRAMKELKDLGPWSREAFDLFVWRPPEWDEEGWCAKKKAA